MVDDRDDAGPIDSNLMQGLLKLTAAKAKASADQGSDLAISRLTPEDRARALDLAATLIRQARKEATGTGSVLGEEFEEAPPTVKPGRPIPKADSYEERQKAREILFRGTVYKFKRTGVGTGPDRRVGVVECWETEIDIDGEDDPFTLVVEEFVDGRFSPWAFEGVFFKDFVQAAIVGVVAGGFQAKWMRTQWRHHQDHRRLIFVVIPVVALFALLVGMAIGLRLG